jgi:hypothetical protein
MKKLAPTFRTNKKFAKSIWGNLSSTALHDLKAWTEAHGLSVAGGDLQLLDGRWYVTHRGLLYISRQRRCCGIRTAVEKELSNPSVGRWVFKATAYTSAHSRGFVGYGDADPTNVSSMVHGAEMRVAETRAVNRALRKAYGIGLCSVEELGWTPNPAATAPSNRADHCPPVSNGRSNGQPRLRDRFCLLIRQHQLDAGLVKAYAADFCGTPSVREASREQIAEFIDHLAERAAKDREGLLSQLNSYRKPQEVTQ